MTPACPDRGGDRREDPHPEHDERGPDEVLPFQVEDDDRLEVEELEHLGEPTRDRDRRGLQPDLDRKAETMILEMGWRLQK